MANYYLDPISGNDTNDGLSSTSAWLTYAYTRQQVAAGDKVYILPGTSYEQVNLLYSGTAGNEIEWICCPNGVDNKDGNIIIDRKGKCIISSIDKYGNTINAVAYFNFNAKNYNILYGLEVNSLNLRCIYVNGNNCTVYNCTTYGYGSSYGITCVTNTQETNGNKIFNSKAYGSNIGISYFNLAIKCKSYTYQNAIAGNQNVICCYGSSPLIGFITGSVSQNTIYLNNTAENNQYGFYYNAANLNTNKFYNNITINSFGNIYISIAGNYMANFKNHYSINVSIPHTNITSNTSTLDVSDTYYQRVSTINTGARYTGTANVIASPIWLSKNDIKNNIVIQNQTYDNTYTLESFGVTTDLEEQPLDLIDGIRKVGAIQQSLISFIYDGIKDIDYYETLPTIKIHRRGIFKKVIRLTKGIHIISAWLKYDLQGGINRPQLMIKDYDNNKLVNNTTTTISNGTGFRYIESSFTVKQDGEIVFMFFNQETHVDSYCIVSDIKII